MTGASSSRHSTCTQTHRGGGGSGQQRQNASTRHDQVVHHLGDEVDAVVNKHDILTAVHKVQNRLGGVTEERKEKKKTVHVWKPTLLTCYWFKTHEIGQYPTDDAEVIGPFHQWGISALMYMNPNSKDSRCVRINSTEALVRGCILPPPHLYVSLNGEEQVSE